MKPFSWYEIFETDHARVLVVANFVAFLPSPVRSAAATTRSLVDVHCVHCVLFIGCW